MAKFCSKNLIENLAQKNQWKNWHKKINGKKQKFSMEKLAQKIKQKIWHKKKSM